MSDILVERKTVGSKGEVLPSKRLREMVGLKPGDPIEIRAEGGTIIIRPAPDPLEGLNGVLDTNLTIRELKRLAEDLMVEEAAEKILKQPVSPSRD